MDQIESTTQPAFPVYNIKAIARLVGLLPVTLRAWERRYGLPNPSRGEKGYRLYSEYDLQTLRWLKNQIEAGMNISQAVDYLTELRASGRDPTTNVETRAVDQMISEEALSGQLEKELMVLNEIGATEILRRAIALYPMDHVLLEIIQPMLVRIGEAWHSGAVEVAAEHFATQFVTRQLMAFISAAAAPYHTAVIAAACAPGETHQVGLLMLVAILRWHGWDVRYFGPDLDLESSEKTLVPLRPRILMFTATRVESAERLNRLPQLLGRFQEPAPVVVLGGQAFKNFRLENVPAVYIQDEPKEMMVTLEGILSLHEKR